MIETFFIAILGSFCGGALFFALSQIFKETADYISDKRREKSFKEYQEFVEFQKRKQRGDFND